jgi:hypothetical protein
VIISFFGPLARAFKGCSGAQGDARIVQSTMLCGPPVTTKIAESVESAIQGLIGFGLIVAIGAAYIHYLNKPDALSVKNDCLARAQFVLNLKLYPPDKHAVWFDEQKAARDEFGAAQTKCEIAYYDATH